MRLDSVLLVVSAALASVRAGNTTCKTTSLDWYTQSVGETPCRTYERLRQSCNPQYQVGNFGPNPPGDRCDDQVSTCCSNSVAFALSMLCENCQYGLGSSINGDTGFDAAAGTYQIYLGRYGPGTNQSLPKITQAAVCNQGINIPNYLYTLFWVDGAWFYEYTKGTAQLEIQSGQNITKFCNTTTTSKTSSTSVPTASPSSSSSNSSSDDSSSLNVGAIAGGIVGGVGLLVIAALVFWFSRRRRSRGSVDLGEEKEQNMTFEPYVHHPTPAPAPAPAPPSGPTSYGTPSSYTHPNTSSDAMSSSAYTSQPPRRTKPGMVARDPPTRDEIDPSTQGPESSAYSSDRHEDSAELSQVFGIGRSTSGRLPPTYQER